MSDESSDEYHEDSLPDLILSSSVCEEDSLRCLSASSLLTVSAPDLLASGPDDFTDIEAEYFTSGDQVSATCSKDGVRVSYSDHSKVYLPKMSGSDTYRSYLNLAVPSDDEDTSDATIAAKFQSLGWIQQGDQRVQWTEELAVTEQQIRDIRAQLITQYRKAELLRRKLGLTPWQELSQDVRHGWSRIRHSPVYHKVGEKLSGFGGSIQEFKDLVIKDGRYKRALEDLDKVKTKALEDLEKARGKAAEELEKAREKAAEEIERARAMAAEELRLAQRRSTHLSRIRLGKSREYRATERKNEDPLGSTEESADEVTKVAMSEEEVLESAPGVLGSADQEPGDQGKSTCGQL